MMGCLDTGSNECYCRVDEANALGIDLSNAISGLHQGIDGTPFRVLYAEVRFRLSDGRTHLEWPALIGFTTAPIRFALLCFAGFLQFFTAEFEGNFERVTLSPNALFPASSA